MMTHSKSETAYPWSECNLIWFNSDKEQDCYKKDCWLATLGSKSIILEIKSTI